MLTNLANVNIVVSRLVYFYIVYVLFTREIFFYSYEKLLIKLVYNLIIVNIIYLVNILINNNTFAYSFY